MWQYVYSNIREKKRCCMWLWCGEKTNYWKTDTIVLSRACSNKILINFMYFGPSVMPMNMLCSVEEAFTDIIGGAGFKVGRFAWFMQVGLM